MSMKPVRVPTIAAEAVVTEAEGLAVAVVEAAAADVASNSSEGLVMHYEANHAKVLLRRRRLIMY
jgi:hypothetical protein